MQIDISLLRIMKYRDKFYKMRNRVPSETLDKVTDLLLADFGRYFDRLPDAKQVNIPDFIPMFRAWHPKLSEEHQAAFKTILSKVKADVPEAAEAGIMSALLELRLAADIANLTAKFEAGDVDNIYADIDTMLADYRRDANVKSLDYLRCDISELLKEDSDDSGLRFRLSCLNDSMRPARSGDFFVVAGRPDRGKTTFLSSEMTFMAPQLPADRPIIWLNNEGPGRKIFTRLHQSALGMRLSELIELDKKGLLKDAYNKAIGGPWRIRTFDIHGRDIYDVERIIEDNKPGVIVYDMIDNIRGFKDAARTDLALEEMYKWGRELCVKYDTIGIASSQISQEGDGQQFPTLPMLKDSKTGKQGACDVQIMIGASNDLGFANQRFIGLPKNKNRREGGPSDPRTAVAYKPEIGRYEDIPGSTED